MNFTRTLFLPAAVAILLAPSAAFAQSRAGASRVDFDDQLVQGQVNRGAVHLIERKDSDLGSLVKVRKNYRKEILAGTPVEAAVEQPKKADLVAPKGLPVVKPVETVEAPKSEAKAGAKADAKAPAAKVAPAKAKPAPAKKITNKKSSSKSTTTAGGATQSRRGGPGAKPLETNSNGGSRVVSRR